MNRSVTPQTQETRKRLCDPFRVTDRRQKKTCEYKFHTEFQSHEPEFDYLKSLEIEEKINKIKWCRRQNASHYLLSTNDKTIKLWKVFEKSLKVVAENNLSHDLTPGGAIGGGGGPPRPNPNVSFRDDS